ncbi:MAG: hypothetical protein SGPRY_011912, partial [Prymnesium sp.]
AQLALTEPYFHRGLDSSATDLARRANNRSQAPLAFIHIPKTGGSAVEAAGLASGYHWGNFVDDWPGGHCPYGKWCERELPCHTESRCEDLREKKCGQHACNSSWLPCSPWHLPPIEFARRGLAAPAYNASTDDTFCVVRNPYDRVMSELVFEEAQAAIRNGSKQRCDRSWMKRALLSRMEQMNWDPNAADCHWLPQWMYVDPHATAKMACGIILRFEDLEAGFRELMFRRGIHAEVTVEKLNGGCALDGDDHDSMSKHLIRRMYERDFLRFGYPM